MESVNLSWDILRERASQIAEELIRLYSHQRARHKLPQFVFLYGIPRGGVFAACLIGADLNERGLPYRMVEAPEEADVFIDDVIDSGKTREEYKTKYGIPFLALVDKRGEDKEWKNKWIVFPWERMACEAGPANNIRRIIEYIGDDPDREGLKETPERVIRSYEELFSGYKQKPADIIKVFDNDGYDEMIMVKDIEFYSTCEHHMLPFYGKAHIAYIPNKKIIGISKLARILEIYARRLQIQEQLCQQITEVIDGMISPMGSACIIEAQHLCMTARGVGKQNSIMVTSSLTGSFKTQIETRNEFISFIKR